MLPYKIVAKTTIDLSEKEWCELTCAFNIVFKKKLSTDYFKSKYFGSSLGYSVHGMLINDDQVVGMFTAIPRDYTHNGNELTIALGCDAFILKEHRKDEYFLKQMADVVTAKLKEKNIYHCISIPNKSAYPYWKYYGGWKDIGRLNYYILPLRISKLIGRYRVLDIFSFWVLKAIISLSSILAFSKKSKNNKIKLKKDTAFLNQRFISDYNIKELPNEGKYIYRIYDEDNIRTAYLIDCYPSSKRNISKALKQIIKDTEGELDIILFVGKLDNTPFFFFKVPRKKEPRIQPLIGLSLDNSIDKDFFSLASWDVNLANFDNR